MSNVIVTDMITRPKGSIHQNRFHPMFNLRKKLTFLHMANTHMAYMHMAYTHMAYTHVLYILLIHMWPIHVLYTYSLYTYNYTYIACTNIYIYIFVHAMYI